MARRCELAAIAGLTDGSQVVVMLSANVLGARRDLFVKVALLGPAR